MFYKGINSFPHILKIEPALNQLQQLASTQMSTQGTPMQITKNDLNSRSITVRYNRAEMVTNKLTYNPISQLKYTITSLSQCTLRQKPVVSTNLLLLFQLLQKRSVFINSEHP